MDEITVIFNEESYTLKYNAQTGYYEKEIKAPEVGGVYKVEATFEDLFENQFETSENIQILAEQKIELKNQKVFMWIFDHKDFSVKDIVEIVDYQITIDEETNSNSTINVLKDTGAKARDLVAVKINNQIIYWGIIQEISNNAEEELYVFNLKHISNMFNQDVILENENLIKSTGVEDFIANTITSNFINNTDTFVNLPYLEVQAKTHNTKQVSVTNVNNNIYNLYTWMTNCTQNYNIVYNFSIVNGKLLITIETKELNKELIDTKAQGISNYSEVFETNVTAKVTVLTSTGKYNLYLLNDRTTTTDANNTNRAEGTIVVTYTEKMEDANQTALDVMKSNTYNHNISFSLKGRYIPVGTPIAIKTKKSIILDTYISAVSFSDAEFFNYTCGNIRVDFIDKLLKERK